MKTFITSIGELNNHLGEGYKPCNLYTFVGTESVFETGFAFRNCLDIAMLNEIDGNGELIKLNTTTIEDNVKDKILNLIRNKKQLLSDYGINEYLIPQGELDNESLDKLIRIPTCFNKYTTVVYIDNIDNIKVTPEELITLAKVNEVVIIVNKVIKSEEELIMRYNIGTSTLLDYSTFACNIKRNNKLDKENGLLQFEIVKNRNPIMPVSKKFIYEVENLYK